MVPTTERGRCSGEVVVDKIAKISLSGSTTHRPWSYFRGERGIPSACRNWERRFNQQPVRTISAVDLGTSPLFSVIERVECRKVHPTKSLLFRDDSTLPPVAGSPCECMVAFGWIYTGLPLAVNESRYEFGCLIHFYLRKGRK